MSIILNLPKSWEHLTIGQFLRIRAVKNMNHIDGSMEILSIATGTDIETLRKIDIHTLVICYKHVAELMDSKPPRLTKDTVKIKGIYYKANLDLTKATAGQYVDIKSYAAKGEIDNIHFILACIFIEQGKVYDKQDKERVSKIFYEHMTMDIALAMSFFFTDVLKIWIDDLAYTSMMEMAKSLSPTSDSMKNTDGSSPSIPLQEERSLNGMR